MQGEKCDTIPVVGLCVFYILNYVNGIRTLNNVCMRLFSLMIYPPLGESQYGILAVVEVLALFLKNTI